MDLIKAPVKDLLNLGGRIITNLTDLIVLQNQASVGKYSNLRRIDDGSLADYAPAAGKAFYVVAIMAMAGFTAIAATGGRCTLKYADDAAGTDQAAGGTNTTTLITCAIALPPGMTGPQPVVVPLITVIPAEKMPEIYILGTQMQVNLYGYER